MCRCQVPCLSNKASKQMPVLNTGTNASCEKVGVLAGELGKYMENTLFHGKSLKGTAK